MNNLFRRQEPVDAVISEYRQTYTVQGPGDIIVLERFTFPLTPEEKIEMKRLFSVTELSSTYNMEVYEDVLRFFERCQNV